MYRSIRICLSVVVVFFVAATRLRAEDPVLSGPQSGEKLPPLKVLAIVGDSDVGEVDFVEQANGNAVLFVFQHERTRPSLALTRVLMNYGEMRRRDDLFPAAIRLTDDPSAVSRSLRSQKPWRAAFGVSPDGPEGPGSYGLNRNVAMTILVGNKGRVTASFSLIQPSVTDAPKILSEVVRLIGGPVPTRSEVVFLGMNQDAAERFRRNGVAPQDPELRKRICAVLATNSDVERLEVAAAEVDAWVSDDAVRQRALGEASRLLLNQRYRGSAPLVGDSPMGHRFKDWAEKFGKSKETRN